MKSKKTYVYYCPQDDSIIESNFMHRSPIYMQVKLESGNYLFPWINSPIQLAVYAECYYIGIL